MLQRVYEQALQAARRSIDVTAPFCGVPMLLKDIELHATAPCRTDLCRSFANTRSSATTPATYGGYSALVGATFTPDVFAAAIDYCGLSNLVTFLQTVPEH